MPDNPPHRIRFWTRFPVGLLVGGGMNLSVAIEADISAFECFHDFGLCRDATCCVFLLKEIREFKIGKHAVTLSGQLYQLRGHGKLGGFSLNISFGYAPRFRGHPRQVEPPACFDNSIKMFAEFACAETLHFVELGILEQQNGITSQELRNRVAFGEGRFGDKKAERSLRWIAGAAG